MSDDFKLSRSGPAHNRWKGGLNRYVVNQDGCWIWTGATNGIGYGILHFNHQTHYAHRAMYEREIGPIPHGLELDHLCRVTLCINPEHLEPVTCRTNLLRGKGVSAKNAAKTHCPEGHEYRAGNVYRAKDGSRRCRECTLRSVKLYSERKKAVLK